MPRLNVPLAILIAVVVFTAPIAGLPLTTAESGGLSQPEMTATNGSTLQLAPADTTVKPGNSLTYQVRLTNVSHGVGAFNNVTVSVNDTGVAEITSISTDVGGGANSDVESDGSSAWLNLPFGGDTNDTGTVTIVTVEVSANSTGHARLNLSLDGDISKENGKLYSITAEEDATLTVQGQAHAVSLRPGSQTIANGSNGSYRIVFENATGGIGSFEDINVSLSDTSVAEIRSIRTDLAGGTSHVASDGSSASVNVPFGADTAEGENVTLATVVVRGTGLGETDVSLTVTGDIASESGSLYRIGDVTGATVNVTSPPDQPVTEDGGPPSNTDDDAQFEDVSGNGEFDIGDIQALFSNMDTETIIENTVFFDFNGNGQIDIGDIQALFSEYREAN